MSAPNPEELGNVAGALGISEELVEKDWYVVQVLNIIAARSAAGITLIFCGGTSLSKAHGLIQRFSEDIDFRFVVRDATPSRAARKAHYREFIHFLYDRGYAPISATAHNEDRTWELVIQYPSVLPDAKLRPHIKIEVSFYPPRCANHQKSVASYVSLHRTSPPEVQTINCLDPIETGADKLSALIWRLTAAYLKTKSDTYKPGLVRHMYDLAILESLLNENQPLFVQLATESIKADIRIGKLQAVGSISFIVEKFLEAILANETLPTDYDEFVSNYVFSSRQITYDETLRTVTRLTQMLQVSLRNDL